MAFLEERSAVQVLRNPVCPSLRWPGFHVCVGAGQWQWGAPSPDTSLVFANLRAAPGHTSGCPPCSRSPQAQRPSFPFPCSSINHRDHRKPRGKNSDASQARHLNNRVSDHTAWLCRSLPYSQTIHLCIRTRGPSGLPLALPAPVSGLCRVTWDICGPNEPRAVTHPPAMSSWWTSLRYLLKLPEQTTQSPRVAA